MHRREGAGLTRRDDDRGRVRTVRLGKEQDCVIGKIRTNGFPNAVIRKDPRHVERDPQHGRSAALGGVGHRKRLSDHRHRKPCPRTQIISPRVAWSRIHRSPQKSAPAPAGAVDGIRRERIDIGRRPTRRSRRRRERTTLALAYLIHIEVLAAGGIDIAGVGTVDRRSVGTIRLLIAMKVPHRILLVFPVSTRVRFKVQPSNFSKG